MWLFNLFVISGFTVATANALTLDVTDVGAYLVLLFLAHNFNKLTVGY
jgi:hypothetical protein